MSTHVCLVSAQLIPNVLPVLAERPRQAVLLITPQMENQGRLLEKFFRERGVQAVSYPIPAYDFAGVLAVCKTVIQKFCTTDEPIITLNVTGGTKVAALAAYQQFYFASQRIIYTDTANERILELGDTPTVIPLAKNLLKVKDYLACYGKHYSQVIAGPSPALVRQRRQITARLCKIFLQSPETLRELNYQISEYRNKGLQSSCTLAIRHLQGQGAQIGDLLVQGGIATPVMDGQVYIDTEESLFYLGGGWLEEFVYNTIVDMSVPGLDCRLNVHIEWLTPHTPKTRNELDIVFTHRNRLHIVSCKTSGIDRGGPDSPKGKEALYELDSMADNIGGLFARSMLLSAHAPQKASRQRAKDLGIEIVAGRDILALGHRLRQIWDIGK